MPYIIYSQTKSTAICRWDGNILDLSLRDGEIAIPCIAGADPNDPMWATEAADYDTIHALSFTRAMALERIDQMASAARERHITSGVGQESTYLRKESEADAYVAAGRPEIVDPYPLLMAEATATNSSVSALADIVRATRDQWVQVAAFVEGVRMGAKGGVSMAIDIPTITALVDQAKNQLEMV